MYNPKLIGGVEIILDETYPQNTMKPIYYLNKFTRKIDVKGFMVSQDIYNRLQVEYGG